MPLKYLLHESQRCRQHKTCSLDPPQHFYTGRLKSSQKSHGKFFSDRCCLTYLASYFIVYALKFGRKNNFFIFLKKCLLSIYLSTLRWIYPRKMRGYPQFSFWISIALFNGMIYIVIFWKKKILPALVSTVLKGRLIDSIAHYPAEL